MTSETVLLSYSAVGMAAREVMLLKSFVRILEGRTAQRWLFKPQQGAHEQQLADLIFLGDDGAAPEPLPGVAQGTRQLRMGVLAIDLYAKIDRPLRPDQLERELNRMGSLLVQARSAQINGTGNGVGLKASASDCENGGQQQALSPWRPVSEGSMHSDFLPLTHLPNEFMQTAPASLQTQAPPGVKLSAPSNPIDAKVFVGLDDALSFLRWPAANVVATPARLKLAAFMVGGTTLAKLQKNSGQSIQACTEFVQDVHAAGFLSVRRAANYSQPGDAGSLSVRIEASDAAPTVPPAEHFGKAFQAASLLPSLFSRIRARLGISPAS